jgi:hypothetical protein
MCIAGLASFDEANASLRLEEDVLVEIKEKPIRYTGQRVLVSLITGQVIIEERASGGATSSRQDRVRRTPAGEKIWAEYKLDYLLRMAPPIEVLTLSVDPITIGTGYGCIRYVVTAKQVGAAGVAKCKAGEGVHLIPPTDAKKVMLVNYRGQEPRNWIPYDESVEESIVALSSVKKTH